MKITHVLTESPNKNPVVKFTIDDGVSKTSREVFGDSGFKEIQKLDNFISDEYMATIKLDLQYCRDLWNIKHNKNKEKCNKKLTQKV